MQVSEIAAQGMGDGKQIENFHMEELFDPKTNLEAGAWYLHRAMLHWQAQDDPAPFALAEYNAGASRAQRWAGGDGKKKIAAREFQREDRFPRDAEIRGVDPRALPVLPAARADVIRQGRVIRRRRKSLLAPLIATWALIVWTLPCVATISLVGAAVVQVARSVDCSTAYWMSVAVVTFVIGESEIGAFERDDG